MMHITQAEKEKFLAKLSESDFREVAVRRLFKRTGFRDGRDLCGPEELGKDCIFFENDRLGGEQLVCIQTKVGPVTMASEPAKSLMTIINQIEMALKVPFKCVASKRDYYASKVYLIASGTINGSARNHILTATHHDTRIKFLDRDDLIKLIDIECPEIWHEISADLFPYLSALSKLVEDRSITGALVGIASGFRALNSASDVEYVELKLVKSVSTHTTINGQFYPRFDFKESNLTELVGMIGAQILLLGDAGSGKSTLLTRAAYMVARQATTKSGGHRVPVLLRANELARAVDIVHAMRESIREITGSDLSAFTEEDLRLGNLVVLVDGLDEIANAADRVRAVAHINAFFSAYPLSTIILATRPYSSIESIDGVRGYVRYRISTMSFQTAEKLLLKNKKIAADPEYAKEILRRIDKIHGIELNPLLVSVFAATSVFDRRDIPANMTELFSKFTELMLGRWDEAKGLPQQFESRVKEHVLAAFAHELHAKKQTQFRRTEFERFLTDILTARGLDARAGTFNAEIIERSGLFRNVEDEIYEFRHHLLQEYFAGKGISGLTELRETVADEWWRNAIVFYFGAHPAEVQTLLEVATTFDGDPESASLTIGLALQSCYLSRLDEKTDVWKWVIERLGAATKASFLAAPDGEAYPLLQFLSRYIIARDAVALQGIDRDDSDALSYATSDGGDEHRQFWGVIALLEIGRVDLARAVISRKTLKDERLKFAVFIGARLIELVRSVKQHQKEEAKGLQDDLRSDVSGIALEFGKQYRTQLFEFRRGGIVALNQDDEERVTPKLGTDFAADAKATT